MTEVKLLEVAVINFRSEVLSLVNIDRRQYSLHMGGTTTGALSS